MEKMTTVPLFKIKTDQDRVSPDQYAELSQFLEVARLEDQEDGGRW